LRTRSLSVTLSLPRFRLCEQRGDLVLVLRIAEEAAEVRVAPEARELLQDLEMRLDAGLRRDHEEEEVARLAVDRAVVHAARRAAERADERLHVRARLRVRDRQAVADPRRPERLALEDRLGHGLRVLLVD